MPISDGLLPELESELRITRSVLERVPDDRGEWRPHEKSFSMAHLAQLVARLPGWVELVLARTELDIAPKDGPGFPGYSIETTATLLAEFDRNAESARAAMGRISDEELHVDWAFKRAGTTILTQSRYLALRTLVLNHLVHHRAQLGMYLRLTGQKVPQMYGPTSDDRG